jgi:hypothetical protein
VLHDASDEWMRWIAVTLLECGAAAPLCIDLNRYPNHEQR